MSGSFRSRRPASPPGYPDLPLAPQSRFPHDSKEHLDADARLEAASKGAGPSRAKSYPPGGLKLSSGEWKLLGLLVLIAAAIRLYRISKPSSVVFDEVHFGKFASKYIKTQYFVDVHPPLAKLLITLVAFVFGYDGQFDFKDIGKIYENVPYVAMRMVPALLGIGVVPITYLTLRALDCRATTALIGAVLVIFENALVTQSRFILLDSPLVFFTALTIFLWVGFTNEDKQQPFTKRWWKWLTLSGLSLGAVVSCKWVGLFTIATVGFSTIYQLWVMLGDLRISPALFTRHFLARALCLIVIPIFFYMTMFEVHFLLLENSGDGDGFMSAGFQHTLGGRSMEDTFADVAMGSVVSLRHLKTQGGYLHSHPHDYPGGSKQQQITLYPHRDTNNDWRITNVEEVQPDWDNNSTLQYITPHMQIRLVHIETEKRLHSHDYRPPISDVDFQNEVSAYGAPGFLGDANDNWVVEVEEGDHSDPESWRRLRTLRTHFRLRHALTGCYLFSHKVKLPEWGFEQQEVTCNKQAVKPNSLWYIETNIHPQLVKANAPKVNYKLPGFFGKFFELQEVMWNTNAGLTDRHAYDSRPSSWPRLIRGINFWVKDHRQIYLIGNPMIWWLSSLTVLSYVAVRGALVIRAQRGFKDFNNSKVLKYDSMCGFLFMGWSLHYLPFYLMSRQLFLHHYLPALYFAILLCCATFDLATSTLKLRPRLYLAGALLLAAVYTFSIFSPLAYGTTWTRAKCENAKWLKTWDFACHEFLENYSDYSNVMLPTPDSPVTGGNGRAEVVAEDKPVQNGVIDAESTEQPIGNRPQPGHDAFAQEAAKEYTSEVTKQETGFLSPSTSPEEDENLKVDLVIPADELLDQPIVNPPHEEEQDLQKDEAELAGNNIFDAEDS